MRIQTILISLITILSSLAFAENRPRIELYVEAGREFHFTLYDYTQQGGTYLFDKELAWAELSDTGELTLQPKVAYVGSHFLVLEVKKDELSSLFYDLEIEVKKTLDVYSFDLEVDKPFAKLLSDYTGVSGNHSFVGSPPAWLNLTEDGILFGKPSTGGKEEILIRVEDSGKISVYWVVLEITPLEPSIGSFVKIRPGTFWMGSPGDEEERESDEVLHKVTLTRSFEIQTTEVTQAQWYKVMGNNPSVYSEAKYCPKQFKQVGLTGMCPNHPVDDVSWYDVRNFLVELNQQARKYYYRLPTEAEWEYAARGKTQTAYSFGNNSTNVKEYAWFESNSSRQTHPVATKRPNPIGLYDVHGNVSEWVEDAYRGDLGTAFQTDPLNLWGFYRIWRGGDWNSDSGSLRCAHRSEHLPDFGYHTGFRLVRTPPPSAR